MTTKTTTSTSASGRRASLRQTILWIAALAVGLLLGLAGWDAVDGLANFIASVYTRLFQFLAVPTIALAIMTTLASLGQRDDAGRIFRHTLTYTLLTTVSAAAVGLLLYQVVRPENLPAGSWEAQAGTVSDAHPATSVYEHILNVVPDNLLAPFLNGNVLSVLLIAAPVGLVLGRMSDNGRKQALMKGLLGVQDVFFALIHALIRTLPLAIVAFSAQFSSQLSGGMAFDSLGRYVGVILGGNLIQFAVVLPLFLLSRGLNPLKVFGHMSPAVLMALFTKSSAATLPLTMQSAEERLGADRKVSRFVLPICTTINMNGCAAFILVTSLFLMQNGGAVLTWPLMLTWLLLSVLAAIGNAGVPMGCYFLTLSLASGTGAPIGIMGIILPIYTLIDMVETAENVWSDSCVCAMVDKDLRGGGADGTVRPA